jgi:hypothetical protein
MKTQIQVGMFNVQYTYIRHNIIEHVCQSRLASYLVSLTIQISIRKIHYAKAHFTIFNTFHMDMIVCQNLH